MNDCSTHVTNKCLECQALIKVGSLYCALPAYCRTTALFRKRDPKRVDILNKKETNNFHYLVGLLCSDGNITYATTKNKKIVSACYINMNTKDEKLLEDIVHEYGGGLKRMKDGTTRWSLTFKPFVDYLRECGLTHNKSLTLNVEQYFTELSHHFKLAFLRGIIDGDGSIKKFGKSGRLLIFCSGNEAFLKMIKTFIDNSTNVNGKLEYRPLCKAFYLLYGGRYAKPILNEVYKDENSLKLERKYKVYVNEFKNWIPRW